MNTISSTLDKEILLAILENLQESVFVTDGEGKILLVNSIAVKLLGIPAEEMVGYYVADMLKKGNWTNSAVLEAIRTRKTAITPILCKNGTRNISTSVPIFDEQGEIKLIITNSSGESTLLKLYDILESEKRGADRYKRELEYLRHSKKNQIIAESPAIKATFKEAFAAARMESSVILTGETGVGKDIVAKYIYMNSNRAENAFVDINCAAIPDNLFEAELFGYERGAFTGANSTGKMGLFEAAGNGTVFLDEIAELPMPFQAKLLRVLENREFRRVGSTKNIKTNARIICATNRNLRGMVEEGSFRGDLYYRLNEFKIHIEPLRNRQEDILPMAHLFLNTYNEKYRTEKYFSERMKRNMLSYSWPGNIRELHNVVSRSYIVCDGLELDTVSTFIEENKAIDNTSTDDFLKDYIENNVPLKDFREGIEAKYIKDVIDSCQGNIAQAAKVLGVHRSHLYRRINRNG